METDLISLLFAPFEKEIYCNYFLILEIICFIWIFVQFFLILYLGITYNEGGRFYLDKLNIVLLFIVLYFESRLLYSMCIHAM